MTYLDLIRDADRKLDKGDITLGEYEKMIEPLNREIDHIAESSKKVERTVESTQNVQDEDLISRKAAIELAMKYCPDDDGAVQCDGDIRGLLDELEDLPSAQPETPPYVAEIESEYKKWVSMPHINKPLAKALYEVWKKHDRKDVSRNG